MKREVEDWRARIIGREFGELLPLSHANALARVNEPLIVECELLVCTVCRARPLLFLLNISVSKQGD